MKKQNKKNGEGMKGPVRKERFPGAGLDCLVAWLPWPNKNKGSRGTVTIPPTPLHSPFSTFHLQTHPGPYPVAMRVWEFPGHSRSLSDLRTSFSPRDFQSEEQPPV